MSVNDFLALTGLVTGLSKNEIVDGLVNPEMRPELNRRMAVRAAMENGRLPELIEKARAIVMTPAEEEEQRRSFAYGNLKLHNPSLTRADIDTAAEKLADGK